MKMVSGWWSDRVPRAASRSSSPATRSRPSRGRSSASPRAGARCSRSGSPTGSARASAPRRATRCSRTWSPPENRGRAFGLQRAMDNAGAVAGPLLAAFLLKFVFENERSGLPARRGPRPRGGRCSSSSGCAKRRAPRRAGRAGRCPRRPARCRARFWTAIGIFVLFTLASSTDAFLLLRARDTGMPLWQLPLLWAVFHAVKAAAGVPGGALADRLGRVRDDHRRAGSSTRSPTSGFAFVAGPTQLWGLFAFYALFYALTEGAERALVADLVPAELRGRAFGAFHASVGLASLPASILFGVWWKVFGPHAAFLIGAAIALAASVALAIFGARTSRSAGANLDSILSGVTTMGPVWRLIKGQKDMCHRCGKEILDFPAVGQGRRLPVQGGGEVLLGLLPVPHAVRRRRRPGVAGSLPAGDQARHPVTELLSTFARLGPRADRGKGPRRRAAVLRGRRRALRDEGLPRTRAPGQPRPREAPRQRRLLQRQPVPEPDEPLLGGLRALRLGQEGQRARRLRDGDRRVRRRGGQGLRRGRHRVPHRRRAAPDVAVRVLHRAAQGAEGEVPRRPPQGVDDGRARLDRADRADARSTPRSGNCATPGMDSCPGGGAEIFARRVRDIICKNKISGERWLEVARECHRAGRADQRDDAVRARRDAGGARGSPAAAARRCRTRPEASRG